jgi:hypothetical protein
MTEEEKMMTDATPDSVGSASTSPLELLLSDPDRIRQIGAMVNSMMSGTPRSAESTPSVEKNDFPDAPLSSSTPQTGGMDGLASLLSNPALLQSLPQILATVKPMMEKISQSKSDAPQKPHTPSPEECRNNLLLALKPFLSKERKQAVDSIIGLTRLTAVFQQLK